MLMPLEREQMRKKNVCTRKSLAPFVCCICTHLKTDLNLSNGEFVILTGWPKDDPQSDICLVKFALICVAVDKSSAICFSVSESPARRPKINNYFSKTHFWLPAAGVASVRLSNQERTKKNIYFFQTLSEQQFCTLGNGCNIPPEHLHTLSISCLLTSFSVMAPQENNLLNLFVNNHCPRKSAGT